MPTTSAWVAWRRILSCKQDSHVSVYDPKGTNNGRQVPDPPSYKAACPKALSHNTIKSHANAVFHQAKKRRSTSSVCCNDLKNVVHGNTRVMHRGDQDSPLSHHHSSPRQLKVLLQEPSLLHSPRMDVHVSSVQRSSAHHGKKGSTSCYDCSIAACEPPESFSPKSTANGFQSRENGNWYSASTCHKCGDSVSDGLDALEEHYTTHHAVTELKEGDSARSIVEIIFQTSWLRQDIACARPERIFKVHNSPKTIAKFEDYREMVKLKASKISKRHSRCLVDGNELLRFYSTTVACRMGKTRLSASSSSPWTTSLCASASCGVCQILKHGFPTKGQPGIYTNASSSQAHDSSMFGKEYDTTANAKRAMLVCRVIAGRVKKSGYESSQDGPISGYDSVAGEAGLYTDLEELLVFNNKAVLPCFVVVYSA